MFVLSHAFRTTKKKCVWSVDEKNPITWWVKDPSVKVIQ